MLQFRSVGLTLIDNIMLIALELKGRSNLLLPC